MLVFLESEQVVGVDNRAARVHIAIRIGKQDVAALLPMYKIIADRVSPVHISPLESDRIMLEEQVISPLVTAETVRVIEPAVFCGEMQLRAQIILDRYGGKLREAEALSRLVADFDVKAVEAREIVVENRFGVFEIDLHIEVKQQFSAAFNINLCLLRGL